MVMPATVGGVALPNFQVLTGGVLTTSSVTLPADSSRTTRFPNETDNQWTGGIFMMLGGPDAFEVKTIVGYTHATGQYQIDPANPLSAAPGLNNYVVLPGQSRPSGTVGTRQVLSKNITSAANAGDVVVATCGTNPVVIESIVVYANAAITADMTSIAIGAATAKAVTLISAVNGAQANLNAQGKQVASAQPPPCRLAVAETVVATLVGIGATAVNFQIVITYYAESAGGVLS